jgi:hypothetical protein
VGCSSAQAQGRRARDARFSARIDLVAARSYTVVSLDELDRFRRWRAKLAAAVKSAARAEREALRQNANRASKYAASSAATIQSAYVRDGNPRYLPKRRSTRTSENLAVVRAACCGMPAVAEREQAEGQKEERQEEHVAAADDEDNHCDRYSESSSRIA